MAEKKNTKFSRPGGYAQPKGATQIQRKAAKQLAEAEIKLYGDSLPAYAEVRGQKSEVRNQKSEISATKPGHSEAPSRVASDRRPLTADFFCPDPDTQLYIGDCREVLADLPEKGEVDLIFADPPFNWDVPYAGNEGTEARRHGGTKGDGQGAPADDFAGGWNDAMSRAEYERFTFDWLDGCIECLAPHGSLWVNIPDDTAAEVVLHCKRRGLTMINWCIWHFRFGQNRNSSFIMSKVHALYFAKNAGIKASRDQGIKGRRTPEILSLDASMPRSLDASMPRSLDASLSRIWNPNDILEVSDRASIYADPRTMNKDSNKGLRVPMDVWYGKYWGRIQGNNKERRHDHHNQIPEIYLERVIKACSNPVTGWASRDQGIKGSRDQAGHPLDASMPGCLDASAFGSLVLDPFCGSGTTSTVARALGRRSITIEYSEVNAKSAWERITKVGMVEREDAGIPQSTAIFKSRRNLAAPHVTT